MSIRDAELDPPEVEQWLWSLTGRLAFDIGGNNGRVARGLSGRFAQVVSCEPAVESFERLAAVPGVIALNLAVSDKPGEVQLAVQANHIETGQLTSPTDGGEEWIQDRSLGGGGWGEITDSRVVTSTTVDALSAEYGDPDFIKCDVEGHEGRVFDGAMETVRRARPALYIEVHSAKLGDKLTEMLAPFYPELRKVKHPYYQPTDFGADNHFWLVSPAG